VNTTRPSGRLCVEGWSPDYGSPLEAGERSDEPVEVRLDVEVPAAAWEPRRPPAWIEDRATVAFVDGVRRIDAGIVWTTDDGNYHPGFAASVAAGVVLCNGRAEIERMELDRVLLLPVEVDEVVTRHGRWRYRAPQSQRNDPGQLSIDLQQVMAELEVRVASAATELTGDDVAMVVIDGPIRRREQVPNAVGHIKTHHQRYLPGAVAGIIAELDVGQRTPIFEVQGPFPRLSWYLRLPGTREHGWSGIVRNEIALTSMPAAQLLADRAAATLGRFASRAARDPRAPQNLTPVSGLEDRLRHRMGDATLLYRALRSALA
jgi:hypothetical protein